jgi:aspartate carbamoyltransferase regulatory subunit
MEEYMQKDKQLKIKEDEKISKIENGTVIDHISPGCALKVIEILGIKSGTDAKVSFVMNISSLKTPGGKKDIVKIESRELKQGESETDKITVVSPDATINIVRNYEIVKKFHVNLPDKIACIIICPNPNCATNNPREMGPIETIFKVINKRPTIFECHYCGFRIDNDIIDHVKC